MNITEFEQSCGRDEYYVLDLTAKQKNDEEEPTRPSRRARRNEVYGPFDSFPAAHRWAEGLKGSVVQVVTREIPEYKSGEPWMVRSENVLAEG